MKLEDRLGKSKRLKYVENMEKALSKTLCKKDPWGLLHHAGLLPLQGRTREVHLVRSYLPYDM